MISIFCSRIVLAWYLTCIFFWCQLFLPSYIWILMDVIWLMMDVRSFPVSSIKTDILCGLSRMFLLWWFTLLFIERRTLPWTFSIPFFFVGFRNLKVLNLGFNEISDGCLVHLKGWCFSLPYTSSKTLVFNFRFVFIFYQWKSWFEC